MIALKRIRTGVAIHSKYRGAEKIKMDKALMDAQRKFLFNSSEKLEFNSNFWKTSKTQLKKESKGKCAYCEANTQVVAHGDVEHYRPKSIYWWLAYTYDNYLYACQICNQTYKSDNFPIGGNRLSGPAIESTTTDGDIDLLAGSISPDPLAITSNYTLQRFLQEHKKEKPFLINPYFDDPEKYFAYEADDILKEVKVVPAKPATALHVKAAEDFYGINRIELKNIRYKVFRSFQDYKKVYQFH
ncbi:MAG: hypothetical protein HC830_10780 [Bacteroidetes bacterium]|nr:hypothetical protein [Bacteroidota bacterium]